MRVIKEAYNMGPCLEIRYIRYLNEEFPNKILWVLWYVIVVNATFVGGSVSRGVKPIVYLTSAWLSCEYYSKEYAQFRRDAARLPYEIVKTYRNRIVADQFLNVSTSAAKFARVFRQQDSRRADSPPSYNISC